MRKILFLTCLLGGLLSGLPAYSQVTGFTVLNVNPGYNLTAGQTVQIKYSLDFTMHEHKYIKIVLNYGPRFTYLGMASTSSNLFSTVTSSTGVTQLNTVIFNAGDENWNSTAEFTVSFTVNYSECNSTNDAITAEASTESPFTLPDNIFVSTGFTLNNLNSTPTVAIEKIEGEECQTAIYKITSFGLDNPNSQVKLTVPQGTSVVSVSNSAGQPVSFGGGFPTYNWNRNGNALNTLQIFYVMLNFSPSYCSSSGVKELKVEFSTHNVCNSGGSVTVFSQPLPIGDCCTNPPPVQIAGGVTLEKYLVKTPYRYFSRPDNCKTHDYIIELTNYTANPLSNLNISDDLSNVLAGHPDGLLITDINVELISLTGASQTITYSVTPAAPLYGGTTITSGSGYQRIYVQSTASWPAYDGIWPATPNFNLATATFPGYSKLRIKITHRLDYPNYIPTNYYINIAHASFNMNGAAYSGSDTLITKIDNHDPVITLSKRVKNVTTNTPYQSSVNASPGDGLEFEIRIKNIGMANITGATLTDLTTFLNPSTSTFYFAPASIVVSTSSPGYTAAEIFAWQTALTNGFNNIGNSFLLPPIKAATCPGYTEIVIKYKVLVHDPAIVLCNSIYDNKATLSWNWNGPQVISSQAKANIDLFQKIEYKFEAICDTSLTQWSTKYVNGVPGTFIYFKASIRNTNTFQVNGLKMMVQLPNTSDNISIHGPATLTSAIASPTPFFTPQFYSPTPPFATSPNTPDGWLNSSSALPANGANPIALYAMGNLAGSGGTMIISYRVLVPINVLDSIYTSAFGVSMSLGVGCDTIVRTDSMKVKIVTSNPCKTLTSCEQIMYDASVQYTGANNFKIAITNILDVAGFNVELMDIIVHQPYKDCPTTGLFAKPRLPFALGTISSTNPPFTLVSPSPVGYRYYPLANNSGSTVSFGNATFNFTANVTANPVCQLVFPVNIRFKSKSDKCKICESTIYLKLNHVTTYILPDWKMLVQDGLLKTEEDPLNIELNKERITLVQSHVGKQIEEWYADVKAVGGIAKALENYPMEVFSMFAIGRRMIEKGGTLTAADVTQITKGMQLVDKEITPAPKGLIAEIVIRLNSSVGKKWPELLANLKK